MSIVVEDVKATVDELLKAVSTKNVISEPYEVGDKVIITITKIGLGFGTGKGESKGSAMGGAGQGVGGAVGVTPIALIVINKNISGLGGVEVKSLAPPSGIGKAIGDIASSIIQGMSESRAKKEKEQTTEKPKF
jgi:uncharacterized spore protein YtfJ